MEENHKIHSSLKRIKRDPKTIKTKSKETMTMVEIETRIEIEEDEGPANNPIEGSLWAHYQAACHITFASEEKKECTRQTRTGSRTPLNNSNNMSMEMRSRQQGCG